MRFLVDLSEEEVAELDALARSNNSSRTAEVRDAVRVHLRGRKGNDWIAHGFGYWKDRTDIGDAVDYQRAIREDRDFG